MLWGEVDLNGQVRPVAAQDLRLSQARRLGFEPIVYPDGGAGNGKEKGGIATIAALQQRLFRRQ